MKLLVHIKKMATLRFFLLFLILTIITVVAMGYINPQILTLSGGQPILDIRPGYSFAEVEHLLTVLGEQGRQLYTTLQVIDLVFPIAYGMSITLALTGVIIRLFPEGHTMEKAIFLPILGMIFDYLENITIATLIASYPNLSPFAVNVASIFTQLKWTCIILAFALLVILAILALSKKK
ncbi:MAG: hypothetical protein RTU09_03870 [Candidatus Thorarchaeota archaeon]